MTTSITARPTAALAAEPMPSPMQSWPPALALLAETMTETWKPRPLASRPLTDGERSWISTRLSSISDAAYAAPDRKASAPDLTAFLLATASGAMTEAQATAKVAAYAVAVEDVPAWAIKQATRAWYRGDASVYPGVDFAFQPSPAVFAKGARSIWHALRGEAVKLKQLLDARAPAEKPAGPRTIAAALPMMENAKPPKTTSPAPRQPAE